MQQPEKTASSTAQTSFQISNATNGCTLELLQKRWFCITLDAEGKTCKQEAESPDPFIESINHSVAAWVDFITDDPYNDLPVLAAKLGFSETLVAYPSSGSLLNYQDFDTEMFMKLPSIQIRG
jgi:hypothetical protein